jgi:hypothetical protein
MRAPFTLTAQIRGMASAEQVFAADLVGAGNAFRVFDRSVGGKWIGGENQFQYRFTDGAQPVPEPATLLLFASGAAIMASRSRRRRG